MGKGELSVLFCIKGSNTIIKAPGHIRYRGMNITAYMLTIIGDLWCVCACDRDRGRGRER